MRTTRSRTTKRSRRTTRTPRDPTRTTEHPRGARRPKPGRSAGRGHGPRDRRGWAPGYRAAPRHWGGDTAPAIAAGGLRRGRIADVCQLPADQLVVGRHRCCRAAGMGADTPTTTPAGGLGYGFLFGLAFYVPLLPWISHLVGAMPWLALATVCALFPGLFGLFAVVVRRLPGWPVWFALLWAAQEWLKSVFPFGGFPWGAVAFGQAEGPLLPLVQLGGVALLSIGVVLVGFSLTAIALEIEKWWRTGSRRVALPPRKPERKPRKPHRRPRWCFPASASVWCCSPPSSSGRRCGTPVRDQVANPRSPSRPSKAMCPGWVSTSTRNVERYWTTTLSDNAAGRGRACRGCPATPIRHLAGGQLGHRSASSIPTPHSRSPRQRARSARRS